MSGNLKLWEFADTLQALWDTREGADDPAVIAEIDKAIEGQMANIAQKADGVYEFISRAESEAARLAEEAKRLAAKKKTLESRVMWMKENVMAFLRYGDQSELKGEVHSLVRRLNPEALNITNPDTIPARYLTIVPASIEINKEELKKALKAGVVVAGAELTRGERIERK